MTKMNITYQLDKLRTKVTIVVANALPKWVVYHCAIRLMAHATTGQYSSTVVPDLAGMDALKRWETS